VSQLRARGRSQYQYAARCQLGLLLAAHNDNGHVSIGSLARLSDHDNEQQDYATRTNPNYQFYGLPPA